MGNVAPLLLILLFVAIAIMGTVWTFGRSRQLLEDWAATNGYRLISADDCWIRRGPFFWTTSKAQTVYRIIALDDDGEQHIGWARCGSVWWDSAVAGSNFDGTHD